MAEIIPSAPFLFWSKKSKQRPRDLNYIAFFYYKESRDRRLAFLEQNKTGVDGVEDLFHFFFSKFLQFVYKKASFRKEGPFNFSGKRLPQVQGFPYNSHNRGKNG